MMIIIKIDKMFKTEILKEKNNKYTG